MTVAGIDNLRCRLLATCICAAAVLLFAGDARAADRSDPIPPAVGPSGGFGFYVNPAGGGLDPARVQAIVERSLARWGNTFLGLTTATAGVVDGASVIGLDDLPSGVLGEARLRSSQTTTPVVATRSCVPVAGELSDTVRREDRVSRARLRRDVLSGRRVRRRTVRRKIRVPKFTRVRAPAPAQLCTIVAATTNSTPSYEADLVLRPAPASGPWTLGPALPSDDEYDFESVVLHELGHISGLAHHTDDCDPSTPMQAGGSNGSYWHGVDDWRLPGCPVEVAPAPPRAILSATDSEEPLPGAGARALAGHAILINARVPTGYDSARFVAVASRAVRRAGGTVAGIAETPPSSGDGLSVLGFAPLGIEVLATSTAVPHDQVLEPYAVVSCPASTVRLPRQVVVKKYVRKRGRRLRRDVIRTKTRSVAGYTCTSSTRPGLRTALLPELDLRMNELSVAWELGPRLPTDGTRWDLETALLKNIMSAGGVPAGARCDTTTPNSASAAGPGDWWRSTTEVRQAGCTSPLMATASSARGTRTAGARTAGARTTGARTLVHRAGGVPADVRLVP